MILRAIFEAIRTLRRRVLNRDQVLEDIWATLRWVWCSNHNLPVAVCWTPSHAGGFGIEPPRIGENWHIVPAVPKADLTGGFEVLNQLPWRSEKIKDYARDRYGLDVSHLAAALAKEDLLSTVTADNVPAFAKQVRTSWLTAVRKMKCRAVKTTETIVCPVSPVNINAYSGSDVSLLLVRLKSEAPLFGCCPEVAVARQDYVRFGVKVKFKDWLRSYYPKAHLALSKFHKSWHMSEALDYISGSLKICPKYIHPALVKVLAWLTACSLKPQRKAIRCSSLWLGSVLETTVKQSEISQHLYWC